MLTCRELRLPIALLLLLVLTSPFAAPLPSHALPRRTLRREVTPAGPRGSTKGPALSATGSPSAAIPTGNSANGDDPEYFD